MRFNFTIQDASPLISYTGLWTEGNPLEDDLAAYYDGSFMVTNSSNAKAMLNFIGTGVAIFGASRGNHGGYSVTLDHAGSPGNNPDQVHDDTFKVDLWHAYDLTLEMHTVEMTNEPVEGRPYFDVDFISIEREIGQDGDNVFHSMIDDAAPNVQYHGSWESDTTMQEQSYNRTLHITTQPDDHVEITFQGCCIELYGLYTNAGYNVILDQHPPVEMQGVDVDLPGDMWHPQTLLYLVDGLSEDSHTVSLTATNTNIKRPFSFDYAVVRSTQNFSSTENSVSSASSNIPRLSPAARVGLAVGLSLGGIILLGLLVAGYFLRRRSRLRHVPRLDLMAEAQPYKFAPAPTPWISLRRPPVRPPRSDGTFQLSSVMSGWHRMRGIDEQTETGEWRASTQWGTSSITEDPRRGSVLSSPLSNFFTLHPNGNIKQ